jgi:hypothetical protein
MEEVMDATISSGAEGRRQDLDFDIWTLMFRCTFTTINPPSQQFSRSNICTAESKQSSSQISLLSSSYALQ